MKVNVIQNPRIIVAGLLLTLAACNKETSSSSNANTGQLSSETGTLVIAVAGSNISGTAKGSNDPKDSIYVIQNCPRGSHRDTVAASALPAAITGYLNTNYAGYTFAHGYKLVNKDGSISGYAVIIQFNAKPVGLEFDANGIFVKVLEQREGRDLDGRGWHAGGGRFEDRDGKQRDTVALGSLPASVLSYMTANYPEDTLVAAFRNKDSSLLVLSKNNGVYATVFSATGSFLNRAQLPVKNSRISIIAQTGLPANTQAYLTATYPNFVFKKAFVFKVNGTIAAYVVVIDANTTKYAVLFDASGNFVKSVTIR